MRTKMPVRPRVDVLAIAAEVCSPEILAYARTVVEKWHAEMHADMDARNLTPLERLLEISSRSYDFSREAERISDAQSRLLFQLIDETNAVLAREPSDRDV